MTTSTQQTTRSQTTMSTYITIFSVLLVLLVVTVVVAQLDLGSLSIWLALAIAFLKASLVAAYFMHLRESKAIVVLCALAGMYWLAILIVLTAADFASR